MQLQNQTSAAIQLSKPFTFDHPGGFGCGFADVAATCRWDPPVIFFSLLFLSPTRAAPTVRCARSARSNPPRGAGGDARVLSSGWRCRGSCWCGGAGGRPRKAVAVGDEARRGKPRGHAAPSLAPSAGGLHGAGAEADAGGRLDHNGRSSLSSRRTPSPAGGRTSARDDPLRQPLPT